MTKLRSCLLQVDIDASLTIPIAGKSCEDILAWHFDKKGIFNVRSVYYLAITTPCASSSSPNITWKGLWSLDVPLRSKIFLWKLGLNILPTADLCFHRKLISSPSCTFCGFWKEDVVHALFLCPRIVELWAVNDDFGWLIPPRGVSGIDILAKIIWHDDPSIKNKAISMLMHAWLCRNKSVFSPVKIAALRPPLPDVHHIQSILPHPGSSNCGSRRQQTSREVGLFCLKPLENQIKLNFDY